MLEPEYMLNAAFGSALAPIGDFNGDGIMDLACGAPFKDLTGVLYILYLTRGRETWAISVLASTDKSVLAQ